MTNDATRAGSVPGGARLGAGLGFAVASAFSFGLSGTLAKGLIEAGWSSGAAVTVRVALATLVLAGPAIVALRGRWHLLRRNLGLVTGYGLAAVAGCQLAYFYAVEHLDVGVALLIEYTAPVAVLAWMWWRHGHRPGRLTLGGAALALARAGAGPRPALGGRPEPGRACVWALLAMLGAAVYFVVSAERGQRPAADRARRRRARPGHARAVAGRAGRPGADGRLDRLGLATTAPGCRSGCPWSGSAW